MNRQADGAKTRREARIRRQAEVPERLQSAGGLVDGAAREVATETGGSEAEVFGVASFFSLLARPEKKLRVCTGLSCRLAGADEVLAKARSQGLEAEGCSCLAACDKGPAVLKEREVLDSVRVDEVVAAGEDWRALRPGAGVWLGAIGPAGLASETAAIGLDLGEMEPSAAFARAAELGATGIFDELETAGLQGRGGAGFPAHIKWRAVAKQDENERFIVLNADEGEPGTFKDREVMMRRPDLVVTGLVIAARAVAAANIYLYLRGEFSAPWRRLEETIARFREAGHLDGLALHLHAGQGAYICGEETALLEALEGKRGMPRLKPPFPVEKGLWQKPTLIHNVETIACVPGILLGGGEHFRTLGRTEPGTKLYCVSGHIAKPGTYELPLGVSLDELVEAAGGYIGELKAFSPGGASSGFLPAAERTRPLDVAHLAEVGSMLGSAGVVVLNDTVDLRWAALEQLRFFEDETCGQCAPCRIGTRYLREALDHDIAGARLSTGEPALTHANDVAWQMREGSICGLGQIAALPLTSARKYFPEDFASPRTPSREES
jgi:NADH:ubiquinone oxidoreductase subunit F (NADH-binding)/NADH:ubiquinone oxidoreductase subunit E